ncbi:hypothetical protein EVAR_100086_1 [Eumeta japonica]|uniref:Uncharacterized protein n=1 Tax=Eumeta variegata TaxID=151549 RepID=A0A4C1Z019_EUMVA|nr:hypothetical protein EVAR_100086_1 [Eumeta japonica]
MSLVKEHTGPSEAFYLPRVIKEKICSSTVVVYLKTERCRRRVTALWVPLSGHLGIEGHVKFTAPTETSKGDSGRRGESTGLMTFIGRNE